MATVTTSTVPAVKTGLRQFLATQPGLTTDDGVLIHSAPVTPEEAGMRYIILAGVTAPQAQEGLARRAETPTLTCYSTTVALGADETAIVKARDDVYELLAIVEAAIRADPSAAGTIPPPGQLVITSSTLDDETPIEIDGTAARRALLSFQLSWTSHIG